MKIVGLYAPELESRNEGDWRESLFQLPFEMGEYFFFPFDDLSTPLPQGTIIKMPDASEGVEGMESYCMDVRFRVVETIYSTNNPGIVFHRMELENVCDMEDDKEFLLFLRAKGTKVQYGF